MSKRVSATERVRDQIDQLFGSERELGEVLEEVARLGVRLLMQAALEAEVSEWLGRERYVRGERDHVGLRNGYQPMTVKTTAGPGTLERPKLRATDEAFASRLLGSGVTRTNALKSLVIAGFVRGLSVRDVEATLAEALGAQAALSKSTVSRICEAIKTEFDAWSSCFSDLKARGLQPPLLGITDGARGLIEAFSQAFDGSLRQRCVVHRARNTLAKVPAAAQPEVKANYWSIFDNIEAPPGAEAVAVARQRAEAFERRYGSLYPAAVSCVMDDLDSLTAFLHFPIEDRERVRHTNLLERTFGESRRRTKVIGRLPGERTCLALVWAVLDRASKGWRGLQRSPASLRLLQDLRRQLFPGVSASIAMNQAA